MLEVSILHAYTANNTAFRDYMFPSASLINVTHGGASSGTIRTELILDYL